MKCFVKPMVVAAFALGAAFDAFTGRELAARYFPEPAEVRALAPPRHEQAPFAKNQRERDVDALLVGHASPNSSRASFRCGAGMPRAASSFASLRSISSGTKACSTIEYQQSTGVFIPRTPAT